MLLLNTRRLRQLNALHCNVTIQTKHYQAKKIISLMTCALQKLTTQIYNIKTLITQSNRVMLCTNENRYECFQRIQINTNRNALFNTIDE